MNHTLPPPGPFHRRLEQGIEWLLLLAGLSSIVITLAIVAVLVYESAGFFRTLGDFKYAPPFRELSSEACRFETLGEDTILILSIGEQTVRLSIDPEAARQLRQNPPSAARVQFGELILQVGDSRLHLSASEADLLPLVEGQGSVLAAIFEFCTATVWNPLFSNPRFGILPLLCGTVGTTLIALLVALPMGSIVAIYLSEYAPFTLREILKPVLELLSAVPTVVYGYFALQFVTPLLQRIIPGLPAFNMLSAGLVMGIMIIPYVSSLSEDALRAVPMLLREGSYALGANRLTTALRVVYPAALSGIGSAYTLGISRAIGETMIVAIAAGMQPRLTLNPLQPAETITTFIVQVSQGDLPHGSIGYQAIFAAGLTLFLLTLLFNIAGYLLRKRFREAY